MGESKYSLILNESTDVANNKWMSMCIRFFSKVICAIRTEFLGTFLVEVTGEKLLHSLLAYVAKVGLNPKNIIALGTDGANNLCGARRGLYGLMKEQNSQLILVKCICHSLHLCCSDASKVFPAEVEYLVKEIYNYFSNNPLRTIKYKRAFDLINTGTNVIRYRKIIQIAGTRWLSCGFAIMRILEQWVELNYHFSIISTDESDFTAKVINELMTKAEIKLYLTFMASIIGEINTPNLAFQSDKMDSGTGLCTRILKPSVTSWIKDEYDFDKLMELLDKDSVYLPLDAMDLGYDFEKDLKNLPDESHMKIRKLCFEYLKRLLLQMLKRLPSNIHFFKSYVSNTKTSMDVYESQWRKLPFIKWKELFGEQVILDLATFWAKVYSYEDASGLKPFGDLAEMVLNMLAIPTSNACVERVFSVMNSVKTRLRSKMQYELLHNFQIIPFTAKIEPPLEMVKLFNYKNLYKPNESSESDELEVFNIYKFDLFGKRL
ncbi:zinc finger MYM-type protein 6-like [Haematobia irritans]|uniref:zinc finger MYM-type protein 6-like n=1 Tax=Haematobia irritans TaxID=7368 RepID=UPI003F4FEF74